MKHPHPDRRRPPWRWIAGAWLLGLALPAAAQDLDPRRWSHLPSDVNYAGAGYAYTMADIAFDPVLELQDVTLDMQTAAAKYIRTVELLNRSARLELAVPYQHARWEGLLRDEPAAVTRDGFADPQARFAVNLVGAPPLRKSEFPAYQATHPIDTTVGAGVSVFMPFGEYHEEKLLNLGENRYTIRPELGVEHRRRKWLSEITLSAAFYTDNDEFWNGNKREQDVLYVTQGYLSYTFRPGLWLGSGIGYGFGGESTVNGRDKNDEKGNLALGLAAGIPLSRTMGLKFAYVNTRTEKSTGADSDTVAAAFSMFW